MFGNDSYYPKIELGKVVIQQISTEYVKNPESELFVTIHNKGGGVEERTIKEGKTPVKFSGYRIKKNQFIYSRIDARNGAFGIVPNNLNGAVVSKDFPVFEINESKICREFLLNCVLQESFLSQIKVNSFGATNRQRIKEDVLLRYLIPLPPITTQEQFSLFVKQVDKSKFIINHCSK